jgi:ribose transport system substrate-binding protein
MRKSLVAAALTASALLLASCAMPADDPNFDPNAGVNNEENAALASAAAADQAGMESALVPPTSLGIDSPLTSAPAEGAVIVSLTDGTEYEGVFETSLAEAADVLGWTVESVVVDAADPAAAATAFDEAVAAQAAGIHITGGFVDALAGSLPAAEAAGIPVICTGCSGEPAGGITDTSINGTEQNIEWGKVLASYILANQYEGEDAGAQVFALPGGAFSDFNLQLSTTLIDQCRNCSATESFVDPTFLDLTDPASVSAFVVGEMSTALGAWAVLDSGALSSGVADALASDPTLLAPVVLTGRGASAADIASLQSLGGAAAPAAEASAAASPAASEEAAAEGEEVAPAGRTPEEAAALQAWIAIPQPVMAWRVIDQFARIIGGGEPVVGPLPSQLLTGANAADAVLDENGNFIGIADYQDQFKALWGVQ